MAVTDGGQSAKWNRVTQALLLALDDVMYLLSNKFQLPLHQLSIEAVPILLDKTWALWDLVCSTDCWPNKLAHMAVLDARNQYSCSCLVLAQEGKAPGTD